MMARMGDKRGLETIEAAAVAHGRFRYFDLVMAAFVAILLLSNVLGAGNINISRMMLGVGKEYAYAAISVDTPVTAVVLSEIAHMEGIESVRPISL